MEKKLITTEAWKTLDAVRTKKDQAHATLEMLHITEKYICATNGRMLVTLPLDLMSAPDPGTYEIISAKKYDKTFTELVLEKREDVQYPDIDRVIPSLQPESAQIYPALRLVRDKNAETNAIIISRAVIELYKATGNAFSLFLLEPLVNLGRTWTIHHEQNTTGAGKALLLTSNYDGKSIFQAVILPFELKNK